MALSLVLLIGGSKSASAARATVKQLEAAVIQHALGDDDTLTGLDMLATSFEDGARLRLDFLRSLLADAAVGRRTGEWLQTLPEATDLHAEWALHFRATMATAVRHLGDAEMEFIFGRFLAPAAGFDDASCARLFHRASPTQEVAAALGLTRADVAEFYRIVERIYLAASTDQPFADGPSAGALDAALRDVARAMPAAAREVLSNPAPAQQRSAEEQGCLTMRATALTLKDVPGESGRLARRDLVTRMMVPSMSSPSRDRVTLEVKGAASARFQPGPVALQYPEYAARAGIEGKMTVRIWIDEEGRATRVLTVQRDFNQSAARLADGTVVSVEEMFDPIVSAFYKSGRFMRRSKEGVPQAYTVEVPLTWKLD